MNFFDYDEHDKQDFESRAYAHAKDHFIGLLEDMYASGNVDDVEGRIDELCAYFGVAMPQGDPVITKKLTADEIRTERMLQSWVGYTRAYAEMMSGSKKKEQPKL